MDNKYLIKRRIDKKIRILSKLLDVNDGIFDKQVSKEKEELKILLEKYINACPHITEKDADFLKKVKDLLWLKRSPRRAAEATWFNITSSEIRNIF